jgi:dTDP-glucose 4,6-dehydratase
MQKLLILTGCAGFIGFNFLKHICETGFIKKYVGVISVDKMGYAAQLNKHNYAKLCYENNIEMLNISIQSCKAMTDYLIGYKCDVVNFASESHVDNSIKNPFGLYNENALLTSDLVSWIGMDKIDIFYHIDTDENYGSLELDTPKEKWFKITDPYRPSNPYAASKTAQVSFLNSISHTFGMKLVIFRLANQFGLHQHYEKMIPATLYRIFTKSPILIYGTGNNIRQWTYVKDTVKILKKYIELESTFNPNIIHIADEKNLFTNNQIVQKIQNYVKNNFNIDSKVEYITDRKGHDLMYALTTDSNISSLYDTPFEQSLEETIKYYKELWHVENN